MAVAPDPREIFDRAASEGQRRLEQSTLELVATSTIAGFTIVFGVAALGMVEGHLAGAGGLATIAGALAFGASLPFLVVGRAELFNENFVDPVAAAVENEDSWLVRPLLRLWAITYALNLIGGLVLVLVLSVEGVMPGESVPALVRFAEEVAARTHLAAFASAIVGGALVSLMSYLLQAVDGVGSRITLSFVVGFFLALGPFDHVVVTQLHLAIGVLNGANVGLAELTVIGLVVTAGNLLGGLGLVTLTHVAQYEGALRSGE